MVGQATQYFKVWLICMLGVLFIWVGLTGELGSLLGAILTPGYMIDDGTGFLGGATEHTDPNAHPGAPGATLSMKDIGAYAYNAGITTLTVLALSIAIAMAESGGKVSAHNPGHPGDVEDSYGLWQINVLAHPSYDKTKLYTPSYNATAMVMISNGGRNWNPWGTYTNGSYRKFLTDATTAAQQVIQANAGQ